LSGKVKEYSIQVDIKNRTITHDCQDWQNNLESKNMCKHLGKFFLRMDEDRARNILRQVLQEKDEWSFKAPEKD